MALNSKNKITRPPVADGPGSVREAAQHEATSGMAADPGLELAEGPPGDEPSLHKHCHSGAAKPKLHRPKVSRVDSTGSPPCPRNHTDNIIGGGQMLMCSS